MIENVEIKVKNKKLEVLKGTTLQEVAKQFEDQFSHPIIVAKVNGIYRELSEKIDRPMDVEFYDLTNNTANRMHVNGLIYMILLAGRELFGMSCHFRVLHSLDKGLYMETDFPLTNDKVEQLEEKMREIVDRDLDIVKMNVTRLDAIHYFESIHDKAKANIMKYNTNTYVTLYKLGNLYSYFYSLMPISTSVLGEFALTYLNDHGFVLRYPTIYMKDGMKEFVPRPNIFREFQDRLSWEKVMKLENVAELNQKVSKGEIADIIRISEILQNNRLLQIARNIEAKRDQIKIILIAGPSSSGKTTTTRKLAMYLRSFGLRPHVISMDDYFHDRVDTPKDEEGNPDYESLRALDTELFEKQMRDLLNGEEVTLPTFNFLIGMKEYKVKKKLEHDDILLIEGIHALNKTILTTIPREKKYKIYISPLTALNIDNQNRVPTTDNRLLRRIVRDNRTRGYRVEDTIAAWQNVRKGEEMYIFPYQDDADATFNTALIYELGVLKTYAEPLLYSVESTSPYYNEAKQLLNLLRVFLPIPSDDIPDDSILREFIGRSYFNAS